MTPKIEFYRLQNELNFNKISNVGILNIPIFLSKKCLKLLHCKSFSYFFLSKIISMFGNKVVKHLTRGPLNKLVKLTML